MLPTYQPAENELISDLKSATAEDVKNLKNIM